MINDAIRIPIESRETWLAMRQQDVTASDVAAVFGASPYKTLLALWAEKCGQLEKWDTENAFSRRGRHLESAILSAAAECDEFAGASLQPARDYWRSPSLRLGATPDAYVCIDNYSEPLDAKSVASWVFDTQWDGGPPLHIQMQVCVQAMLAGARRAWVACALMTPDWPVYVYEIPRNEEAEMKILAGVREFWASVEAREMPSPVAKDNETLARMFGKVERVKPLDWESDTDAVALALRAVALKEQIKPLGGELSAIEAKLKARLGSTESAQAPGLLVTWKEQTRASYVVPESKFRVLRIKTYTPEGEEAAA